MADRDLPIEPQDHSSGVTVVDIGDLRVARGLTRRPASACRHHRLHYDNRERRIWCADCEQTIEAYDAFEVLVSQAHAAARHLDRRAAEVAKAERFQIRSRAAKKLDEAWRRPKMVPACPHCGQGLFPEDFVAGLTTLGRDYALAKRAKRARETGGTP